MSGNDPSPVRKHGENLHLSSLEGVKKGEKKKEGKAPGAVINLLGAGGTRERQSSLTSWPGGPAPCSPPQPPAAPARLPASLGHVKYSVAAAVAVAGEHSRLRRSPLASPLHAQTLSACRRGRGPPSLPPPLPAAPPAAFSPLEQIVSCDSCRKL